MSKKGMNCPRCGNVNDLGRVFCAKCGVRLDLSRVNTRMLAKGMKRSHAGVSRMIRFLLFVLLLSVFSLMLWPSELAGDAGATRDAKKMETKIASIIQAQQAGLYVFEIVSEREVNAYLAAILRQQENVARSEGMRLGLEAVSVGFRSDMLTVVILAAWGPLRLSYEVMGKPVIDADGFAVDITSARWGHLPLPGPIGVWVSARVARVFSEMKRERHMLDQLERCDVGKGKVRLVTKSRR